MNRDENNKKREQELDELLDGALSRYTNAQPRAGLGDRILANLRQQPERTESSWWSWNWNSMTVGGAAVAVVVLVALALSFSTRQHSESQVAPSVTANIHSTPRRTSPEPAHKLDAVAARPRISEAKRLLAKSNAASSREQEVTAVPHQAVFPSPAPPSEQERMMLTYVKQTPLDVLVAVSEEQQQHEQAWLEEMNQLQKSAQKSGSL